MNDNPHDQLAALKEIIHFADSALSTAEKLCCGQFREECRENIEDDYRADLKEVLKLADEIRKFDVVALWD